MPLNARRSAAAAVSGLLAASGLVALTTAAPTAHAAEATATVTFNDCELRLFPYTINQRVADNITWTTPVRLNIPSPIPVGQSVTSEIEAGPFPGGVIPQDFQDLRVSQYWTVQNTVTAPLRPYGEQYVGNLAAGQPVVLEEHEQNDAWGPSGIYRHSIKAVELMFTGTDAHGEFLEYLFKCDQVVNPQTLLTTAVYDLSATPMITVDRLSARQGDSLGVSGTDLLTVAPTSPAARVAISIGGVSAGSLALDPSGAFAGRVTVPPFVRPGSAVVVRVSNGSKTAQSTIVVTARKGKVVASPKKVKAGKSLKLTGSGFKPGEPVKLTLKGGKGAGKKSFGKKAKANASGAFTVKVKLKKAARGAWRVSAKGTASGRPGKTTVRVR